MDTSEMSQSKESSGRDASPQPSPGKRSTLEVLLDVLRAIQQGEDKATRIMFKANLSWNELTTILEKTESQGLVVEKDTPNGRRYKITTEGAKMMTAYHELVDPFMNFEPGGSLSNLESAKLQNSKEGSGYRAELNSIKERLDSLEETIEVLSDKQLLKGIKEGLADLQAGRYRKLKSIDDFAQSASES